jgi:hypothetical protein
VTTVRHLSLSVALAVAIAGCQASHEAGADPVEFTLGQEFTLGGGQEAVFTDGGLHLRFAEVLEDSRCPTEVECFWTGQARIAVVVRSAGLASATVDFDTNPATGQNVQTAVADGYAVSLKSLDPYPRTPDDPIRFEDYRATLSVQKSAG